MTTDEVLGLVTMLFYLVAVPIGIGAFTRGAVWLAVLAMLALPLLALMVFAGAVIAALIATARPTRAA
ncbi:MAG TPA: hypothetical protein VF725_04095 [Ktedonobacterales bacterium]|jgi:hypothetical protein